MWSTSRDQRRPSDDGDHRVFELGVVDGGAEERQRVHLAGAGIDDVEVVMLPARLVLLRAPVVVDGEQHRARTFGDVTEPDRRAAAVRADLEHGKPRAGFGRRPGRRPQRVALVGGHEALGGERHLATLAGETVLTWCVTRCPSG